MGNIAAFLQPPVMGEEKKVWISRRFKGEDGKPLPFVIRVIDQETNAKLLKQATRKNRVNGQMVQEMDADRYWKLLVDACVVEPNFRDSEVCAYYKTTDPLEVPGRMLTAGEYNRLVGEIRKLNELVESDEELEALEEAAKN